MNIVEAIFGYFLVGIMTISTTAKAQADTQTDPAWEVVQALLFNEFLIVKLKDGTTVDGALFSVTERNLKLYQSYERSGRIVPIKKEKIMNIYRLEQKSGKKWRLIGKATGVAIETVTGMALSRIGGNCRPTSGPFVGVFDVACGKAEDGIIALSAAGEGATDMYVSIKRILVYKSK
jgi:hypothetical protein